MKRLLLIVLPLLLIVGCSKPVDNSTLINKDGLMFLPNSDKPYTGEVFINYSTGEKLYQGTYENGLLIDYSYLNQDGSIKKPINYETTLVERESIFYTKDTNEPYSGQVFSLYDNGKKKVEGTLKDGGKDGLWIEWNKDGKKKSEVSYKHGEKDGLFTLWYKYYGKESEGTYKHGEKDGLFTEWYINGKKKSEGTYKHGERDGLFTDWNKDGQKIFEGIYIDGGEFSRKGWYDNGQKSFEENFNDSIGVYEGTGWYENGQKKYIRNYNIDKEWNEDGTEVVDDDDWDWDW